METIYMSLLKEMTPHIPAIILVYSGACFFTYLSIIKNNLTYDCITFIWISYTGIGHGEYLNEVYENENNNKEADAFTGIMYALFYIPYLVCSKIYFFCRKIFIRNQK